MHIQGVSRRRAGCVTTERSQRPAPDLVKRVFVARDINELWVADVTYVPTWEGFLYLAVVTDACSRKVVGWAFGVQMTADLVLSALNMALPTRKPGAVIHHSDQGSKDGFNRSSQHWVIERILDIRSGSQPASSSRAFCEVYCLARGLRLESPGRSTATGRCPSKSIGAAGHWCSRSWRAATDCGVRQRRPLPRTRTSTGHGRTVPCRGPKSTRQRRR